MDQMARRFWLFILPLLIGLAAAGLLVLASFFPQELYEVGSTGYIATAIVAIVSLGVVVWQTVVFDQQLVGGMGRSGR